jgi:hypothetical protein
MIAVGAEIVTAKAQDQSDLLKSGFENPPASARPRVWWHWMNGNISKDGIKAEKYTHLKTQMHPQV